MAVFILLTTFSSQLSLADGGSTAGGFITTTPVKILNKAVQTLKNDIKSDALSSLIGNDRMEIVRTALNNIKICPNENDCPKVEKKRNNQRLIYNFSRDTLEIYVLKPFFDANAEIPQEHFCAQIIETKRKLLHEISHLWGTDENSANEFDLKVNQANAFSCEAEDSFFANSNKFSWYRKPVQFYAENEINKTLFLNFKKHLQSCNRELHLATGNGSQALIERNVQNTKVFVTDENGYNILKNEFNKQVDEGHRSKRLTFEVKTTKIGKTIGRYVYSVVALPMLLDPSHGHCGEDQSCFKPVTEYEDATEDVDLSDEDFIELGYTFSRGLVIINVENENAFYCI